MSIFETTARAPKRLKYLGQNPAVRALGAFLLVLTIGLVFNADGAFFKIATHRDALRQMSVYGILACGMTVVIISGGIDLAVGSILALTAVCSALMGIHWNWAGYWTISACIFIGAVAGGFSGILTARLKMQPFIATLSVMVLARGLAKYVSGGMKVSTAVLGPDGNYSYVNVPPLFEFVGSRIFRGNISVVTLIFIFCVVISWLFLSKHVWGRYLYAIGGNEQATMYSGIAVKKIRTFAYVLSGIFASLAGVCQASQEQQGDPEAGIGYELIAITMVVIGGTSLSGGQGGMGMTLLGVLTIGYFDKILSINAVPEAGRLVLTGIILIIAVLTQRSKLT